MVSFSIMSLTERMYILMMTNFEQHSVIATCLVKPTYRKKRANGILIIDEPVVTLANQDRNETLSDFYN